MSATSDRIDPAEIPRQREQGWPDFHPEDYCHRCGARNPVWASSDWPELVGSHAGILCPTCFMRLAPDRMWKVSRQDWPDDDQVRQLAKVLALVSDCDEPERVARCVLDAGWARASGPRYGVPTFAMLDVWMALGGEPNAFDRMWAEDRRYPADTWAQLLALIRGSDSLWEDTNPPAGPEMVALARRYNGEEPDRG